MLGGVQVFQVMGRSTRATTKECFGDGSLATTLVDTLSDVSRSVQEAICFAICNLCATASCPARRRLLEKVPLAKHCHSHGAVPCLIMLTIIHCLFQQDSRDTAITGVSIVLCRLSSSKQRISWRAGSNKQACRDIHVVRREP